MHGEMGFLGKVPELTFVWGSQSIVRPPRSVSEGTQAGDAETGFPHVKHRRIIVNRRRQLELVEEDLPKPRSGEVRLKMLAAGVSFPDVMMRQGIHPEARKPPFTPGWDIVGVVDELGEGVEA